MRSRLYQLKGCVGNTCWMSRQEPEAPVIECSHDADEEPCDGIVSLAELIDYINSWKADDVTLQDVMGAIVEWKD